MQKIILLMATLAMLGLNGCTSTPQDIPMSGTSETKTTVKMDTTVFGRLVGKVTIVDGSTVINVTDGGTLILGKPIKNMKDIK